jgi:hypothetical protein
MSSGKPVSIDLMPVLAVPRRRRATAVLGAILRLILRGYGYVYSLSKYFFFRLQEAGDIRNRAEG